MDDGTLLKAEELAAADLPHDPPRGFLPIPSRPGFHALMGQMFGRMEDGVLVVAFRCSPRHLNNHGSCHGGMLASMADFAAYAVRHAAGLLDTSIPTATLSVDYLRPVRLGDWVEVRTQLTKRGRNLLFSRMTATVGETIVFTAHGIFVPGPHDPLGQEVLDSAAALT